MKKINKEFCLSNDIILNKEDSDKIFFYAIDNNYKLQIQLENYYKKTIVWNIISKTEFDSLIYNNNKEKFDDFELDSDKVSDKFKFFLFTAYKDNASDIHFEPFENNMIIRFRIDGILYKKYYISNQEQKYLGSHIKILAALNIAEKNLPQDGRIKINYDNISFDIRVSIIPTIYGENIVLRLLNQNRNLANINKLGLSDINYKVFKKLLYLKNGIILVTGPTGSGKTTTLYSILKELNNEEQKIATIEDPIEYEIQGINQTQVDKKRNFSFAEGLRSLLRQDPDIIMVGEIRDKETADIATQAALTGHLVLSTIHTNDTINTLTRLVDIGIPSYLLADTIKGIVAQRLVRKLCDKCKQIDNTSNQINILKKYYKDKNLEDLKLYEAVGCPECSDTGYKGRVGIFEILLIDNQIRKLIRDDFDIDAIINYAIFNKKMITLADDAVSKIKQGLISVSELIRIVHKEK